MSRAQRTRRVPAGLRSTVDLALVTRPINVAWALAAALAGSQLGGVEIATPRAIWSAFAVGLGVASADALNDCLDFEADRVNHPERPIASGRVTRESALMLAAVLQTASLGVGVLVGGTVLILVILATVTHVLYSWKIKNLPVVGNILVAGLITIPFALGMSTTHGPPVEVQGFEWLLVLFFFGWGRELLMDVHDRAGDMLQGRQSVAVILGTSWTLALASTLLVLCPCIGLVLTLVLAYSRLCRWLMLLTTTVVAMSVSWGVLKRHSRPSLHRAVLGTKAALLLWTLALLTARTSVLGH